MKALEDSVRSIEKDGLVWGASKLVAIGYGIKKLQINLVVEDEKVSTDELQGEIEEFEDYVQSTDIAAMQKVGPYITLTLTKSLLTNQSISYKIYATVKMEKFKKSIRRCSLRAEHACLRLVGMR